MLIRADFRPLSPFKGLPESYTIFGSICWGVSVLYGEQELLSMLEEFKESPPFLISSPVFKKDGEFLFPKPILKDGWGEPRDYNEYKERKKAKDVRFVGESVFKKVLDGKVKTERELWEEVKKRDKEEKQESGKKKDKEEKPIFEFVNQPHASINRITWTTEGGELYNEEAVYIGSPLSVFIYFRNESYIPMVKSALRFTQIGGNKTTGMGHAEVSFKEDKGWLRDYLENRTSKIISLSPTFKDDAFLLEKSYYDLFPVLSAVDNYYSRVSEQIWKRRCVYLTKGSSFTLKDPKDYYGKLKPALSARDRVIYHYGFAFPLYVREEK